MMMFDDFDLIVSLYMLNRLHLSQLKHTTTLFSLSDHDILSREWRIIVNQLSSLQTSYHGMTMVF